MIYNVYSLSGQYITTTSNIDDLVNLSTMYGKLSVEVIKINPTL